MYRPQTMTQLTSISTRRWVHIIYFPIDPINTQHLSHCCRSCAWHNIIRCIFTIHSHLHLLFSNNEFVQIPIFGILKSTKGLNFQLFKLLIYHVPAVYDDNPLHHKIILKCSTFYIIIRNNSSTIYIIYITNTSTTQIFFCTDIIIGYPTVLEVIGGGACMHYALKLV